MGLTTKHQNLPVYLSVPNSRARLKLRVPSTTLHQLGWKFGDRVGFRFNNPHSPTASRTLIVYKSQGKGGISIAKENPGNYGRIEFTSLGPVTVLETIEVHADFLSNGELHVPFPKYIKLESTEFQNLAPVPHKIEHAGSDNPYERGALHATIYQALNEYEDLQTDQDTAAKAAISIAEHLLDKLPRAFGRELIAKLATK